MADAAEQLLEDAVLAVLGVDPGLVSGEPIAQAPPAISLALVPPQLCSDASSATNTRDEVEPSDGDLDPESEPERGAAYARQLCGDGHSNRCGSHHAGQLAAS